MSNPPADVTRRSLTGCPSEFLRSRLPKVCGKRRGRKNRRFRLWKTGPSFRRFSTPNTAARKAEHSLYFQSLDRGSCIFRAHYHYNYYQEKK
jgi:hypothetical protein